MTPDRPHLASDYAALDLESFSAAALRDLEALPSLPVDQQIERLRALVAALILRERQAGEGIC